MQRDFALVMIAGCIFANEEKVFGTVLYMVEYLIWHSPLQILKLATLCFTSFVTSKY